MNYVLTDRPATSSATWSLPVLLALFVGSGCSALIYEIVWFQTLQLVIGSSAVSLCVLLGTFMGGMCLGSLLFPRLVSPRWHPLLVYGLLELGIGAIGVAIHYGMPDADRLYSSILGYGLHAVFLRGAVCALFLLPPTLLMGATLPAIARWTEATPRGVSWLGIFYAGNIAGAVFGCLLAGFCLLRVYDGATATLVAAAVNGGVALLSFALALVARRQLLPTPSAKVALRVPGSWVVYVAAALSGMGALSAEVIWTRLLSLIIGGTVYTFSIILAVFLAGLGIGSGLGSLLARRSARPRVLLGVCQFLLAVAIAWCAYLLAYQLPYWPILPNFARSAWSVFQVDLVRCLCAVLPAAILWGASFPLALAAVVTPGRDPGRLVGGLYAANSVGAIVGAGGTSLFLIAWVGTQQTQRLLIGLSTAAALLLLIPLARPGRQRGRLPQPAESSGWLTRSVGLVGATALAIFLAWTVSPVPWEVVAYGREVPNRISGWDELVFLGEGMNASVAVTRDVKRDFGGTAHVIGQTLAAQALAPAAGPAAALAQTLVGAEVIHGVPQVRYFHISGKVEASSTFWDMSMQRMLGHLPALVHPEPRSVLVVGCGAGVTAGSFVTHPSVKRIVICELEPLVPQVVARHFKKENYDVLREDRPAGFPEVEVVYDDARHYVLTTPEKFDIITSDPIHPWVKGAATLYTKEYYELCQRRLNPGGVVTQWVPIYQSDEATVKSQIGTFMAAFPGGTVWGNRVYNAAQNRYVGYDVVVLGQTTPTRIDVDKLEERLRSDSHAAVRASLEEIGMGWAVGLLATYAGRGADLKPWLADAQVNTDRNLRLQYLAGMGARTYADNRFHTNDAWVVCDRLYNEILDHCVYPDDLLIAREQTKSVLSWRWRLLNPGHPATR
jgi:spermidine synthase